MGVIISPLTGFSAQRFNIALGPYRWTSDNLFGGFTFVLKFNQKLITGSGSRIRLVLQGTNHPTSNLTGTINNVTISNASTAAGAKAYDSAASPTAVTFAGGASVALARGSEHVSDEITFEVTPQKALLVAMQFAAGAYGSYQGGLDPQTHTFFWRASTAEAATTTRTAGYGVVPGILACIKQIEVFS